LRVQTDCEIPHENNSRNGTAVQSRRGIVGRGLHKCNRPRLQEKSRQKGGWRDKGTEENSSYGSTIAISNENGCDIGDTHTRVNALAVHFAGSAISDAF
jgi:hypothetical protein